MMQAETPSDPVAENERWTFAVLPWTIPSLR